MFKGVDKGIWVGTENQIFYLHGDSPEEVKQERKAFVQMIPGSDTYIDCTSIPGLVDEYGYQIEGIGVIFIADRGVYLGTENGKLIQFSRGKLEVPHAMFGAGVCIKDRYIASFGDNLYNKRLTVCEELVASAISQYQNYSFNSFATIGGKFYGANSNGIFQLDAADNDVVSNDEATPINAYYKSVLTDFGVLAEKRLRKCNGAIEANGELKFTLISNETQEVAQHTVPALSDNEQHSIEIPCSRPLKGRYYGFVVENVDGADFSIDNLEAFIEVLSRKPEKRGSN
jgi:hypothetical protein